MNPLDWKRAAALVCQHKQAAATAETDQLDSMPLSEISIDDSILPVVHYGSHGSVAASTPAGDLCDPDEAIYDRNRKEIQSELFKDTPVKTEDNKPYIDNIDTNNKDRAQITQSLSDRLGLSQNSLLGAQQVIVATKHTDIPDHLRWISLGEEIESISHKGRDRINTLFHS